MANHIQVPGTLEIDLTAPFNQQGIFNAIRTVYPSNPNLTVVSIAVPLVHINCLEFNGTSIIENAWEEIKNAAKAIYNYMMQYYIQPLWNALYSLFQALESFISGVLDLTIPVFNLHISDLFDPELGAKIKRWVTDLYNSAKGQLQAILDKLGISWPNFDGVESAWHEIEYIVEAILHSLWGFIIKAIEKIYGLIKLGIRAWEIATQQGNIVWSEIFKNAWDSIVGFILQYIINVPTIDDIYNAVVAWAKIWWGKLTVTVEEILEAIKHFSFGPFGKPFDWDLPWNPHISFPNIDLYKMLSSILIYCKNFIMNIINTFVRAINSILEFFGVSFGNLGVISIPITLCAVPNDA